MSDDLIYPGAIVMLSPATTETAPTYYVAERWHPARGGDGEKWGILVDGLTQRLACWPSEVAAGVEAMKRSTEYCTPVVVIGASRPIGSGPVKFGMIAPPDCTILLLIDPNEDAPGRPVPTMPGRKLIERAIREGAALEQTLRDRGGANGHAPPK